MYLLNETYFDNIDSVEKAYWLGFIWGDGYVHKRKRKGHTVYEFKLSLSEKDIGHLKKFKKALKSTIPIKIYKITSGYRSKYNECRFYVSRKKFCRRLYDLGIKANRTNIADTLKFVPNYLYKDFMRGLFDAEGSITLKDIKGRKEFSINITSSERGIEIFNKLLIENKLTETVYKINKRFNERISNDRSIMITGNVKSINILNWLYKNSTVYLDRKYNKYLDICNYSINYIEKHGYLKDGKGNIIFYMEGDL